MFDIYLTPLTCGKSIWIFKWHIYIAMLCCSGCYISVLKPALFKSSQVLVNIIFFHRHKKLNLLSAHYISQNCLKTHTKWRINYKKLQIPVFFLGGRGDFFKICGSKKERRCTELLNMKQLYPNQDVNSTRLFFRYTQYAIINSLRLPNYRKVPKINSLKIILRLTEEISFFIRNFS